MPDLPTRAESVSEIEAQRPDGALALAGLLVVDNMHLWGPGRFPRRATQGSYTEIRRKLVPPPIRILHMRIAIWGISCGGGGRISPLADSMQDAAYRITDADVDSILKGRAHFRAHAVWSMRAPRPSHGQYDLGPPKWQN